MQFLPLLLAFLMIGSFSRRTDSPHGSDFKVSCTICHSSKGWQLDKEIYSFNHSSTRLSLEGQHKEINCRLCHPTLVFSEAKSECNACHNDVHQSTVGPDCSRCHTPASWLVNNINEIHQESRFPLIGAHRTADCYQCHKSESMIRFDVPGIECIDCHKESYMSAVTPNHSQSGFPEDCTLCHKVTSLQWTGSDFSHNSFPLAQAHSTAKCAECHTTGNYTDASTDCNSCHQKDYLATTKPDHGASLLSTNCLDCHTLSPGWKPTSFNHDRFPLKLGHSVPACIDCHKAGNYTTTPADCYSCHEQDYLSAKAPDHNKSGISKDCATCHSLNSGWKPTSFDHTVFPLVQGHSSPVCSDCHKDGNYKTTPSDCYSCHQQNYLSTTNPKHAAAGFSQACQTCHSITPGWKPTTFKHSSFPLTLGHSGPTCIECHKGDNYTTTSPDCYSCHQQNYISTTNPNHVAIGYPQVCQTCHTVNPGWKPAVFNHSSFSLTLGHSTPACADCHKGGNYTSTPSDCYSCHQQDYTATVNPKHTAAGFSQVCQTCHTVNPGWKPTTFNHAVFPLTLGHSGKACVDCHKGDNYTTTSPDCYSCHQQDYTSTVNPKHSAAGFSQVCQTCHTANPGWKPTTFNHTVFPLTLGHSGQACIDCHKGDNYTTTSPDCYSCHQQNYISTLNPNHIASGFPQVCQTCHNTIPGWKPATFNHASFPLTLGHSSPACADCHKGGNYTSTPSDCYSCHQQDYTATVNPKHTAAGFSQVCQTCHTVNAGWKPTTFNHTIFPLTLGHSGKACIDCHKGDNYTTTSPDCYSCHQQNYISTTNPKHTAAGFSQVCQTCHTANPGWKPTTFNHTVFPLTLGHSGQACVDCHKGDNYTTTSPDCYSCHQQNYISTLNPNHIASGFPQVCQTCHTSNPGWKPATFNHTSFPLTLGHSSPACADCHKGGNYTSTPSDCYSCHQQDYTATVNPKHTAAGFSQVCQTCHTVNAGWKPTTFNHTIFPLTLGHSGKACIDCHKGDNYTTTSPDCYSCHQQNYISTTNPKHTAAGFSQVCQTCHTVNAGWRPTTYNHTVFPLTLGHSGQACIDCHKNDNYTNTSPDCYSCHQQNYISTTNPNHVTSGFPQACLTCHTVNPGWKPATFNHTIFPLTLGHSGPLCADCHIGGNYTSTSTDCYVCHKADYDNTVNPRHQVLGFSVTCKQCHTTNPDWKPASYAQHDAQSFPIYSGKHKGEWTLCTECHPTVSNYALYNCLLCHEHNKVDMDSKHRGRSGYSYDSAACFRCHPRGTS